ATSGGDLPVVGELSAQRFVVHVLRPHAGEAGSEIVFAKRADQRAVYLLFLRVDVPTLTHRLGINLSGEVVLAQGDVRRRQEQIGSSELLGRRFLGSLQGVQDVGQVEQRVLVDL